MGILRLAVELAVLALPPLFVVLGQPSGIALLDVAVAEPNQQIGIPIRVAPARTSHSNVNAPGGVP